MEVITINVSDATVTLVSLNLAQMEVIIINTHSLKDLALTISANTFATDSLTDEY